MIIKTINNILWVQKRKKILVNKQEGLKTLKNEMKFFFTWSNDRKIKQILK